MSTNADHGAQDEHAEIHLPDPSIWPLVVGLACALVGAGIIFYSRDRDNHLAGAALAAALIFAVISAAGWAFQDTVMRRKAASGDHGGDRVVRYNQVVTFAIAEGELANARSATGVLSAIERSDLRNLAGFQDLRVQASPASTGPSQVIVETTWAGRENLETYDGTRQSLLDTIAAHETQVVPGSVQVFDMEVLRDTKDTSFRFGLGAAASIFGGLIVGGFMLGAGLTAFQSESSGGGGGPAPTAAPADPYLVRAVPSLRFATDSLQAPPNTEVTFTLQNDDTAPHNLSFYPTEADRESQSNEFVKGDIIAAGSTGEITFTTPDAGTYYFHCDLHPQMAGTFTVSADAPPPGGAPPAGNGGGEGGNTIVATDNKFDLDTLTATAGQPFSVTLRNDGVVPHNISFYDKDPKDQGKLLDPAAEGAVLTGGKSETLTFTPSTAGTFYFQCDVHPTEMNGTFVVQ